MIKCSIGLINYKKSYFDIEGERKREKTRDGNLRILYLCCLC